MKRTIFSILLITMISCSENKTSESNNPETKIIQDSRDVALNQEKANNAIKELISTARVCDGNIEIIKLESPSQFSEKEARTVVHTLFNNGHVKWNWTFKFVFKKDINKQWILTSASQGSRDPNDGTNCQRDLCNKWQDLNKAVK